MIRSKKPNCIVTPGLHFDNIPHNNTCQKKYKNVLRENTLNSMVQVTFDIMVIWYESYENHHRDTLHI